MCGIAGIIGGKVTPSQITDTLLQMQVRGTDATGISWYNGKEVHVVKSACKASEFVDLPDFTNNLAAICGAKWVLMHTRAATHGSPADSKNNHPIVNKHGLLIHNGIVTPVTEHLTAQGQTDSEQLLLNIQKYGFEGIGKLSGWAAIAYVNFGHQDTVYLFRDGAPIKFSVENRVVRFGSLHEFILGLGGTRSIVLPSGRVFKVANSKIGVVKKVRLHEHQYSKGYLGNIPWATGYANSCSFYAEGEQERQMGLFGEEIPD